MLCGDPANKGFQLLRFLPCNILPRGLYSFSLKLVLCFLYSWTFHLSNPFPLFHQPFSTPEHLVTHGQSLSFLSFPLMSSRPRPITCLPHGQHRSSYLWTPFTPDVLITDPLLIWLYAFPHYVIAWLILGPHDHHVHWSITDSWLMTLILSLILYYIFAPIQFLMAPSVYFSLSLLLSLWDLY